MAAYDEDRHWEVNGSRYKTNKGKETTEADFKDLRRFLVGRGTELTKQAANENDYGQEALGIAGLGAGAAIAGRNKDKVIGMENRYHGTGSAAANSIQQQGLLASKAGDGVSTRRANLRETLGDDAIDGKVYVAKNKRIAQNFASQAGMENAGVQSGNGVEILMDPLKGIGEKLKTFRDARKDATVLNARIPYNDLQNGSIKTVPNPELRGLNQEDYVKTLKDENAHAFLFMNPNQEAMVEKQIGNAYKDLSEGTDVIEGDLASRYFKGGEGYTGQNLRGVLDYAKANPGRFARGVGTTGLGLGIAGAGGYGLYDGIRDRMVEKEAETMNRFLEKKAEYGEASLGTDLAYLGGSAAGAAGFLGATGLNAVHRDTRVQGGLHPDVREIMKAEAQAVRDARLNKILANKGDFALRAVTKRPMGALAATLGTGIGSALVAQEVRERGNMAAGEAKTAFTEMREVLEKSASYLR